MRKLDFLIIGAQKSGTTTLFQLLSEHPGIYVPKGKELPFFNIDGVTAQSYAAFMRQVYSGQADDVLIGKVTPHYLSDPAVPARLKELTPETKLAAILRDPVERAFSHYRMSVRRGLEHRSFADAIEQMLQPASLAAARALPSGRKSENQTYVVWGEYGRLLTAYADKIAKGEFLLLSTRELEADPAKVMKHLFGFLQLDMVQLPSLGQKLHQGGNQERIPLQKFAKSIAPLRWLWRRVPPRLQAQAMFRFEQWNVVRNDQDDDVPKETIAQLRCHYAADARRIESLTGWPPDWEA